MKFIDINSVRGLEIDQPVYTKDEDGQFGYGRLIKEEKTAKGITRQFEMSTFLSQGSMPGSYIYKTNITHVCIPK